MENYQSDQEEREESEVNDLLNKVLREEEVISALGINKQTLAKIRTDGKLRYCRISKVNRVYFASDILDYLKKVRIKLG